MVREFYSVKMRDRHKLVYAVMEIACGGGQMSLEGQLSQVANAITAIPGVQCDETATLRRHTYDPIQDFVVFALEWETLVLIRTTVLSRLTLRDGNDVIHLQIAKDGARLFSAYDMDYPNLPCFVSSTVPEAVLKQWISRRLIQNYAKGQDESLS